MVDTELILGIIIVVVAIVTLIRIIKPVLEGIIVIVIIIIGSALIFHATPLITIPNLNVPISAGPNIMGATAGPDNTTSVVVFNAYTFNIDSFSATVNGKPVNILNSNLTITPLKFAVLSLNSTGAGNISLSGKSNVLGFNLGTLVTNYSYSG